MKKSTKHAIRAIAAAAAALLCVTCADNSENDANEGLADAYIQGLKSKGTGGPSYVPPTVTTYGLTVRAEPPNGGQVSRNPGRSAYNAGDEVIVRAYEADGYEFTGWSDTSLGTANPAMVTMDSDKTLTANFKWQGAEPPDTTKPPVTYELTVGADPQAGGSVSRDPDKTNYADGEAVTVTATQNQGYRFVNWSGASSSTNTTVVITMDGNKTLTANFQQNVTTYTVTFNTNGGSGTAPSAQTVNAGNSITLPSGSGLTRGGYTFGGWNSNSSGTGTTYSVNSTYTPTGNVTLYAKWDQVTQPSGGSCPNPVVTDGAVTCGGQTYKTVTINGQTWMAENLNYEVENSKCYNNSPDSCAKYGRLYNWNTAMAGANSSSSNPSGVQGVCPVGWHLPSYNEWITFEVIVGGSSTAGTKLKSTSGWHNNGNGTDDYGFSALPGGCEGPNGFMYAGAYGHWWSATENGNFAFYRVMGHDLEYVADQLEYKSSLSSVRCAQDGGMSTTYTVTFNANGGSGTAPASQSVNAGSSTRLPNGSGLSISGYNFVGWNTNSSGTGTTYSGGSNYTPTGTTVNVMLYAKWNLVTQPSGDFVDDRDGKSYRWVTIGTQIWMAENLNYDVPNNATGDVCYNNSADSCAKYGRLYNWYTAMNRAASSSSSPSGVQGVCPAGWHLPSHNEWITLENEVGGQSVAGTKLKSTSGWNSNGNGTDDYGFSALPGGYGDSGHNFSYAGTHGSCWSATEADASHARVISMNFSHEDLDWVDGIKLYLFSVRCLQDD